LDIAREGSETQVHEDDECGDEGRMRRQLRTGEHAHCGRTPQCRCGVEAANAQPFLEDQAGTKKAYARHHLRRHARWTVVAGNESRKQDKRSRAQCNESVRPEPSQTLAPLPLKTDRRSEHHGSGKIECRLGKAALHHD